MKLRGWPVLAAVVGLLAGCNVTQSLTVSDRAAREFQDKDTEILCGRFTDHLKASMPCDSLERVLRQTDQVLGAPTGKCSWNFTYKITGTDPFQSVTVYKCPHAKEDLKLQVTVEIQNGAAQVAGLWGDSPALRQATVLTRVELAETLDEPNNQIIEPADRANWQWPRVYLWTQWQNLKAGDTITMKWIAPSGETVGNFDHPIGPSPASPYNFWSYINTDRNDVARPGGTWTVIISINQTQVESFTFETDN